MIDQHWKTLTGFQVGEIVRVENEKEVFWKGQIVKIHTMGTLATVKDINPNSVSHNCCFCVRIEQLKLWDSADEVNV